MYLTGEKFQISLNQSQKKKLRGHLTCTVVPIDRQLWSCSEVRCQHFHLAARAQSLVEHTYSISYLWRKTTFNVNTTWQHRPHLLSINMRLPINSDYFYYFFKIYSTINSNNSITATDNDTLTRRELAYVRMRKQPHTHTQRNFLHRMKIYCLQTHPNEREILEDHIKILQWPDLDK